MKDENWLKHSNPLSGWTRFAAIPFLMAALWYRNWVVLGAIIVFLVVNPFLFPRPKGPLRWISRSVLGEKIYCTGKNKFDLSRLLLILVTISFLLALYGAWFKNIYLAVSGTGGSIGFKLWYLNEMVKLYDGKDNDGELNLSLKQAE